MSKKFATASSSYENFYKPTKSRELHICATLSQKRKRYHVVVCHISKPLAFLPLALFLAGVPGCCARVVQEDNGSLTARPRLTMNPVSLELNFPTFPSTFEWLSNFLHFKTIWLLVAHRIFKTAI